MGTVGPHALCPPALDKGVVTHVLLFLGVDGVSLRGDVYPAMESAHSWAAVSHGFMNRVVQW